MQIRTRLDEIMRAKGISTAELSRRTGISRAVIADLRRDCWERVSRNTLARICQALPITFNDLFELYDTSIFAPIRLHGDVTIHFGSDAVTRAGDSRASGRTILSEPMTDGWDLRGVVAITDYLHEVDPAICCRLVEHPRQDSAVRDGVLKVFADGDHILIGWNQFSEEVVCHAHAVPPYSPANLGVFEFAFKRDRRHAVSSSFGSPANNGNVGIVSVATGELVARHTLVTEGQGDDCALIVVERVFRPVVRRENRRDDENIILAILGYDGMGTAAGAEAAISKQFEQALYPAERGKPMMKVVAATYARPPGPSSVDNRKVTSARVLEKIFEKRS